MNSIQPSQNLNIEDTENKVDLSKKNDNAPSKEITSKNEQAAKEDHETDGKKSISVDLNESKSSDNIDIDPKETNQDTTNIYENDGTPIDSAKDNIPKKSTFNAERTEVELLEEKVNKCPAPTEYKDRLYYQISRLKRMQRANNFMKEYDMIEHYIDWFTRYPWDNYSNEEIDIDKVRDTLNSNHYGLDAVKERFLEYLAVRKLLLQKKDFEAAKRSPVICMVGLQGIGKTTMAKSVAQALHRPFYRISLGAIGSVLEIRGRNKAVEGAEPGQIVKAMVTTNVLNPVILLDELDKASGEAGLRTDVMATMLEILDPEQNDTFRDHFLDIPVDLSNVMFIVSANKTSTFSAALLDRLEIIRMPSYTDQEKMVIARDYLLPRVRSSTGIQEDQLVFDENVWTVILRPLGFDSGIRSLQRIIDGIASKAALQIVKGEVDKVTITQDNFKEYLRKY